MIKVFMLYEVNPTTWFYLSSLMIIGIFFKFRRVWSVRNFDILALLCLAPGMLMVAHRFDLWGYITLLFVCFVLILRMLYDNMMVRRPLLEQNLSLSGLGFCGIALMIFLLASIFLTQWKPSGLLQTSTLEQLLVLHVNERILNEEQKFRETSVTSPVRQVVHGPGLPFFTQWADAPRSYLLDLLRQQRQEELQLAQGTDFTLDTQNIQDTQNTQDKNSSRDSIPLPRLKFWITTLAAIVGQIAIVLGILFIGWHHFENFGVGIAAATLYLLIPYVAQMPSRLDHIIPAALMVWAVYSWRTPLIAGFLIGLAGAVSYYPGFLIPLWCGFYWSRGMYRFLIASLGTAAILLSLAIPLAGGVGPFISQLGDIFGFVGVFNRNADSIWAMKSYTVWYRFPVLVMYFIMVMVLAFWPTVKNLGTLISSTAVLMLGAQFCQPFQGGLYMAWFLPMLILTVFRPNLEDRTARRAVAPMWRKSLLFPVKH